MSFSAHPDDEIGGAGGFLIQTKRDGANLKLVLCLDPGEERFDCTLREERATRLKEFTMVARSLGAKSAYLGLPRYTAVSPKTILPLVKVIREFRPEIVLTLSEQEYHPDHKVVAALTKEAVWQASRQAFPQCGKPWRVSTLLQYEADNPMQNFTFLRDISDVINEKKRILRRYGSQVSRKDLVAAVEGLNRFRGIMYKAGDYAEAFKASQFFYG